MVVVVLSDCPAKLRGDLSKWLFEINTGVYVGNVSARVRELLWERICDNVKHGQATMVYSSQGEQKMEFCVHNTSWEIVDFDGIKLMRRPLPNMRIRESTESLCTEGFSKAAKYAKVNRIQKARQRVGQDKEEYVIIDIETTGLSHLSDEILEIGALRVSDGKPAQEFQALIQCEKQIPNFVEELTGITGEVIKQEGRSLRLVLQELLDFLADHLLVCHNAAFDYKFLQAACKKVDLPVPRNKCVDTLILARRKLKEIKDYKLQTIAEEFSVDITGTHRALKDCYITYGIYKKLNEM